MEMHGNDDEVERGGIRLAWTQEDNIRLVDSIVLDDRMFIRVEEDFETLGVINSSQLSLAHIDSQ
uniref:Uncharacterized protein n=1 Tax=Oryza brachyantha TaxID=4533 RepID=J3MJU0_ORYBR